MRAALALDACAAVAHGILPPRALPDAAAARPVLPAAAAVRLPPPPPCRDRKLRREVVDKEAAAYAERSAGRVAKPIERARLEAGIKEFVRLSIRRLHASRGPDG